MNRAQNSLRVLNRLVIATVVFIATVLICSQATIRAQQIKPTEKEEEIDLDSLDDKKEEPKESKTQNEEALLPVNPITIDLERHPAFLLIALAVLVPVSTLLLPVKRVRDSRRSLLRPNRKTPG
jgi:hypothetical protein